MSHYNKFLRSFLGFATIYLTATFLVNLIVDPYGIWKNGGRMQNSRAIKAIKVNLTQPQTVVLGSSGVVVGINTNYEAFSDNHPIYNLGLYGANFDEIKYYFHHARVNNNLKQAILGLDFYTFNTLRGVSPDFSKHRLGHKYKMLYDFPGLYFSLDSLKLIFNAEQEDMYFEDKGEYLREMNSNSIKQVFEAELLEDLSEEDVYGSYKLSYKKIDDFRKMVNIAEDEGIEMKTFLPPIHATLFYAFVSSEHWSEYEQWLREIVKIQPVWDFSGCNSVTTEAINTTMQNYYDASHYSFNIGNLVLNRLFSYRLDTVPSDFGVYVTADNVDEHITNIKRQCEKWKQNNLEVVNWVEELKQQTVSTYPQY